MCICIYVFVSSDVEDAWGALSRLSLPINNWHQCTRAQETVWYDIRLNLLGRRQANGVCFVLAYEVSAPRYYSTHVEEVQEYLTGKPDGEPAAAQQFSSSNARTCIHLRKHSAK